MKSRTTLSLFLALLLSARAQQAPVASPADRAKAADMGTRTESQTGQTAEDPAIKLSPFIVATDQDVGYLATNTLAGSRLNTSLRDTPAAISVLTPEFLSDIGAFNLTEALAYAVNVEFDLDDLEPASSGNSMANKYQTYRVRGLPASTARNYFNWEIPTETSLVDRIEDSRGPNSVLFGIASAGGVINANTKQALTGRSFRKGSFTVSDHASWRGTLDLNQPMLGGKAAIRLNLVQNKDNSFRHWQFEEQSRAHLAGSYRLTDKTRIRAEFEHGQIDSNRPRTQTLTDNVLLWNSLGRPTFTAVPTAAVRTANGIIQNSTAVAQPRVTYISNNDKVLSLRSTMLTTGNNNVITDTSIADYSVNVGGPGQDRSSRFNAFSTFLEHQFSKTSFLELAFSHQGHVFDRYDARGGSNSLKGDPEQLLPTGGVNPFAGQLMLEATWTRLFSRTNNDTGRATFSKELDVGKWGNYRVAALGEYEKAFTGSCNYNEIWVDAATGLGAFNTAAPENTQNNVWRRTYVTEHDWATYYVRGPNRYTSLQNVTDPITGRTLSARWIALNNLQPSETYSTKKSVMLAGQARYFDGRLILAAGFRRDDLDESELARKRDPVTQEWSLARNPAEAAGGGAAARSTNNVGRTKTAGLVYHVTPKLSLFYNRADNIGLPSRGQTTLPPDGTPGILVPVPPLKGEGEDFGLALNLFEGRFYTRATYYTTQGKNQSFSRPDVVFNANTRIMDALQSAGLISEQERVLRTMLGIAGLFDQVSEGVELQVTANATRNWRFQANYARTGANETNRFLEWLAWEKQNRAYLAALAAKNPNIDIYGIVTSAPRTIAEELDFLLNSNNGLVDYTEASGHGKLGNRRHKVSVFTRYAFSTGWLKGAYIGGGYRHQSKIFVNLDPALNNIYGNSYWYADAMAGYQVRGLRRGRGVSFQLNVMNIFDKRDPLVTRFANNLNGVLRQVPQPPLTWRFTTNFEF